MDKKELTDIAVLIINSTSIEEEIKSAKLLSAFFSKDSISVEKKEGQEVILSGGIAISKSDAAVCTQDYLRTARYIKGTYNAIKELMLRFPGQKINILYAGCGPYAALLTPLLTLFDKEELEGILVEINEASIQSVKLCLTKLELTDYIAEIIQADAVTYQKPTSWPVHLLLSETMFRALIREPQIAIIANLLPQLVENGILIPEKISIDLACSFFSNEPFLHTHTDILQKRKSERQQMDTLFSIDKNFTFYKNLKSDNYQYESCYYKVPEQNERYPDLCLYTTINIFKGIRLESGESYITNPYCISAVSTIAAHTFFKLIYNFKTIPYWTYELKK